MTRFVPHSALGALLLTASAAHAQQNGTAAGATVKSGIAANENIRDLTRGAATVTFDDRYEGVKGTPYVWPQWTTGSVVMSSKVPVPDLPLKYDAYRQVLLAKPKANASDSLYLNMTPIERFTLRALPGMGADGQPTVRDRTFRRFVEAPKPELRTAFVEELYAGPYTLLRLPRRRLQKANYQGAYSADQRYDELLTEDQYYLRLPGGECRPVKPTTKAVLAALPEQATQVAAELKRRPALRTEADLLALMPWLNTLAPPAPGK